MIEEMITKQTPQVDTVSGATYSSVGIWFCGYACAFGTLGDFFYGISTWVQKKLKKKLPKIPDRWIDILQNVKYINLLVILFFCVLGMTNSINKISPWVAFSRITMLDFKVVSYIGGGLSLLFIIIGMMLLY